MTKTEAKAIAHQPTEGALTPARVSELMELAIKEGGQGAVEALERLVGLAERVEDRRAATAFDEAILRVRAALPLTFKRVKLAGGAGRDGSAGKSWWYTPLEELAKKIEPELRQNGLWIEWSEEAGEDGAKTVVCSLCGVGHRRSSRVTLRRQTLPGRSTPAQEDAATLSIAMRRAFAMALGIVTSDPEDDTPPEAQGEPITDKHLSDLEQLCDQLKQPASAKGALCRFFRAETLGDLRESQYPEAKEKLVALIEKERAG